MRYHRNVQALNRQIGSTVALALPKNVTGEYFTTGNSSKLLVKRCRYEVRKNFFSNRILNMWNSLPDYVVMSDTINTSTLKNRLDAHWKHREVQSKCFRRQLTCF